MKINVYAKELAANVEKVTIISGGDQFHGLRFHLVGDGSVLPSTVTLWGHSPSHLDTVLKAAQEALDPALAERRKGDRRQSQRE